MRFVSATRWTQINELVEEMRKLGRQVIAAQPKEFASGNVIRRVLAVVREVGGMKSQTAQDNEQASTRNSMFSLLTSEDEVARTAPKKISKDTRADIIEGIQELIDEINNMDDTIASMSVEMIHENEVLLTPTPGSAIVLEFFLRAAQKRKFSVLVCENFPNDTAVAHEFAKKLSKAGIDTVVIPDTTSLAVMSRVGKVIIGARSVLANGGCISSSGVGLVCQCAREFSTPVLCLTGLYKLSPVYPFDIESLIEVGSTGKVIDFGDGELVDKVQVMNPTYDHVPPENIDIFITNIGGYSPSFTYRVVLDHYDERDVDL